ncbi:MAG: flagellar basal body rod protein FlgB [Candidatus Eremiobacteraeota bacterium]|nr:flagellar basal body rod protein FlgB [Candidatus Eremiobacteraeota bacterium]
MSDLQFGATVDMLKNAMDGAGTMHQTLANNIANVNTPNFRRSTASFKEALAATEGTPPDPDTLPMVTNSDRQITTEGSSVPVPFEVKPQVDETTQMRVDKSNVDIDQEMAQLSINSGYSGTMEQLLQVQFMRLRESITGTP